MNKNFPKKGEIYWIDLEPAKGAETKKIRPCLIVSCDIGNEYSPLVMVAPITRTAQKIYPFEVGFSVKNKKCKVMLNQTRALDKSRLGEKIETAPKEIMLLVDKAIKIVFGI